MGTQGRTARRNMNIFRLMRRVLTAFALPPSSLARRTCAVLADRTFQPTNAPSTRAHWHTESEIDEGGMRLEECMLFVINDDGATKIVKRRHWGKFVRRMATDEERREAMASSESSRGPGGSSRGGPASHSRLGTKDTLESG